MYQKPLTKGKFDELGNQSRNYNPLIQINLLQLCYIGILTYNLGRNSLKHQSLSSPKLLIIQKFPNVG